MTDEEYSLTLSELPLMAGQEYPLALSELQVPPMTGEYATASFGLVEGQLGFSNQIINSNSEVFSPPFGLISALGSLSLLA